MARPVTARPARGILLMLAANLTLANMDAISKHLVSRYPVVQILAVRFVVFTVFALALARPRSLRAAFGTRHPWLQLARSIVIAVEVGVFVLAFRHLPLAEVHAVTGIAPLLVTALSVLVLGERVGMRRWSAVALGFVGLLVILRPGFAVIDPAALIPLGGALLWAVYQILVRLVSADAPTTSLLYMAVVGAVATSALAPFAWVAPDAEGWFFLVLLGLIGSLGHLLLIMAFRHAPASLLQPFHYTLLVWAVVLGYLVFGDVPDAWTLTGGAVIAASGIYALRDEARVDRRGRANDP